MERKGFIEIFNLFPCIYLFEKLMDLTNYSCQKTVYSISEPKSLICYNCKDMDHHRVILNEAGKEVDVR